jgi:hypothetical protein
MWRVCCRHGCVPAVQEDRRHALPLPLRPGGALHAHAVHNLRAVSHLRNRQRQCVLPVINTDIHASLSISISIAPATIYLIYSCRLLQYNLLVLFCRIRLDSVASRIYFFKIVSYLSYLVLRNCCVCFAALFAVLISIIAVWSFAVMNEVARQLEVKHSEYEKQTDSFRVILYLLTNQYLGTERRKQRDIIVKTGSGQQLQLSHCNPCTAMDTTH